ncbi:MAG: alpha/beta hydrolase-fold protein [Bacteroidetes bacterium]|nr:alpha/beta hydrolase-fold protein [Bacteroidota bacterium]
MKLLINLKPVLNIYSKIFLVILLFKVSLPSQSPQSFTQFINSLNSINSSDRIIKIDSFITNQKIKGFPIIESTSVYFIYRGNVSVNIGVTGDHTIWNLPTTFLQRVLDTDLYFIKKEFELDARIDYKFVKDGSWILDPLNQNTIMGGFGPNSELAMPNYIQPKEIIYNPTIPKGVTTSHTISSSYLNNSRTIKTYIRTAPNPNYEYPVIYVQDGNDYINLGSMTTIVDNLFNDKNIEPLICVFIPPIDRSNEYRQTKILQYSNFITKEVIPFIDSNYKTIKSASRRAIFGSSDGGHISLFLGINYPNYFGFAAGQSSTISNRLIDSVKSKNSNSTLIYMDCGTYDINNSSYNFLELNRNFNSLLKSKNYNVKYFEYHEGHSWGNWRAHIDDVLKFFQVVTKSKKDNNILPSHGSIEVLPNYPNPFNPSTNITFVLADKKFVTITISDLLGRNLKTISADYYNQGKHTIKFKADEIKSGNYFYTLKTEDNSITRKLTILK